MRTFTYDQAHRPAQTDDAGNKRQRSAARVLVLVAVFAVAAAGLTMTGCAQMERAGERTADFVKALNFRVGVNDGRAILEGSVAGYGAGIDIGARLITPITPGILAIKMIDPMAKADFNTEPERWEIESPRLDP